MQKQLRLCVLRPLLGLYLGYRPLFGIITSDERDVQECSDCAPAPVSGDKPIGLDDFGLMAVTYISFNSIGILHYAYECSAVLNLYTIRGQGIFHGLLKHGLRIKMRGRFAIYIRNPNIRHQARMVVKYEAPKGYGFRDHLFGYPKIRQLVPDALSDPSRLLHRYP